MRFRVSEAYACFVCTAGTEFEEWQQQLKEKDDMLKELSM